MVKTVESELSEYGDVSVHVLSDTYGYCRGDEHIAEFAETDDVVSGQAQFARAVRDAASTADVVVILLTSSTYRAVTADQCDELTAAAGPGNIWCLCASQKDLESADLDALHSAVGRAIMYQRVGAARINGKTRDEQVTAVERQPT
jgi:hypothetical protein